MDCKDVGSRFAKSLQIAIRLFDHEVDVQRLFGHAFHGGHNGHTKGNVGYEAAVHHIHVKPIGHAAIDHVKILLQAGEIGSQYRRCYQVHKNDI